MKIKNIFFDFDGVIAESVSAKTEAFRNIYSTYGKEISDKVVTHHKLNCGVSRFEKFKYYHKEFLHELITEEKVNDLANKFSEIVLEKVINSDEVLGATPFLKKYHSKLKFWIITGTPTSEIQIILKKRKLEDFFVGVYGSPETKKYWAEHIIRMHNLNRDEIVFLGDAFTDMDAAQHSNIKFVLRENNDNKELFMNYKGPRFKDYYQLEKLIN